MKFLCFFLLQFFIVNTGGTYVQVFRVLDQEESEADDENIIEGIDYNPKAELRDEEAYIFRRVENNRCDIIYWLGARAKRTKKINATTATAMIRNIFVKNIGSNINVYITRQTSKPGIKTFEDLMSAKIPEKIPRLYRVTEGHTIRQIPMKSKLDIKNSYVLDDGLSVLIHHSPTCEINRKITDSLAAYIINIENGGNYNPDPTSSSGDEENFETAFETFQKKITSIVNLHSKSKTDVLPKNEVGRSKATNKKFKAKDKKSTKKDDDHFQELKIGLLFYLHSYQLPIPTNSTNRASSTATASSTSTAGTRVNSRKKSKAAKKKTSLKETKNSSLLESEFTNAVTISTDTDSENNKYENLKPIFMGSEECVPKPHPLPIDALKLNCIYAIKDLENYEIFIYLGKDVEVDRQHTALAVAELDIIENSLWKVTIVLPGNPIPAAFMIHIKSEMQKYLLK